MQINKKTSVLKENNSSKIGMDLIDLNMLQIFSGYWKLNQYFSHNIFFILKIKMLHLAKIIRKKIIYANKEK